MARKMKLSKAPIGQVSDSLYGLASRLELVSYGGLPDASPVILIHGTGNINSSARLVVVDGVSSGQLTDINPNHIDQIEVLKNASSAVIYGTGAANGVILVNTKKGRMSSATEVNLNCILVFQKSIINSTCLAQQTWLCLRRNAIQTMELLSTSFGTMLAMALTGRISGDAFSFKSWH